MKKSIKKGIMLGAISLISLSVIAISICFALDLISTLVFAVLVSLLALTDIGVLILFIMLLRQKETIQEKVLSSEDKMTELYTRLGIPVQFNKDGTIKDIYQLLGIEPEYDENGNRIETVYEMIGALPKFDENGNEIPYVFAIKNRAGKPARVDISSRVLIRKLSEKEQEELLIRETLNRRLKEAEERDDKEKLQAIKKVMEQNQQAKTAEKKSKAVKYGFTGKGNAIKTDKRRIEFVPVERNIARNLFGLLNPGGHRNPPPVPPKPRQPNATPAPQSAPPVNNTSQNNTPQNTPTTQNEGPRKSAMDLYLEKLKENQMVDSSSSNLGNEQKRENEITSTLSGEMTR